MKTNSRSKFQNVLFALGVLLFFGGSALLPTFRLSQNRAQSSPSIDEGMEENRPDHPAEALRFRRLQLKDDEGFIPADGLERARQHVQLMQQAQRQQLVEGIEPKAAGIKPNSWTWLGPGNVGGRIRSIVVHPTNTNTMWVGSVSGGIWRTDNAGTSWVAVDDFMANLAVSSIVINPANPNIMYAGTGEQFNAPATTSSGFSPDGLLGAGVFRSTNGGVTWNQLPTTNPGNTTICATPPNPATCSWLYVNRLAISPNGNTILAATSSGIQRSTDGGNTWTLGGGVVGTWLDVDFDPTNSQNAIASANGGTAFSTNGGQNWTFVSFGPGRVEVAYAPSNPAIVYALVDQNNGDVYRSTNGGANFTRVNTGTNLFLSTPSSQGFYDNIIWVNPQDPRFVIVGGIDLWRSIDCGTINQQTGQVQCNFTQISQWQCGPSGPNCAGTSAHADHHVIVSHPGFNNSTNRRAFFGNDGGIYTAADVATVAQTSGWTNLNNNLGITQFYGAAANYNGVFIGGAQDNATLRKPFGFSQAWFGMNGLGGDGGYCASDPTDPNVFYGEYIYLQIARSSDGGVSASDMFNGLTDAGSAATANFIAPFILDPNDPNIMLAGGVNLWRGSNIKQFVFNWNSIKQPVAPLPPPPGASPGPTPPISAIAVSPSNSDFIVVGHNDGQIYRTLNGTTATPTWTRIDNGIARRFVTRLVIDNTRAPNWIYATFGGFSGDNIYRSTDLGNTWTDITGTATTGLPNVPVRGLTYHPRNSNFLYAGTEIGIFASEDAGATWSVVQDGPANVSVDELFWLRQGSELYPTDLVAVTHGRGVYKASFGVYVDCNFAGTERGTINEPYKTIRAAIDATTSYQTIWIRPCNYNESFISPIDKGLEMRTLGNGTVTIGRP